jgi:hypothetical protein
VSWWLHIVLWTIYIDYHRLIITVHKYCRQRFLDNRQVHQELIKWVTKWLVPWFDCDGLLTCRGLNSNLGYFNCFTFIFVSFGESRLLVSWCASGRCGMSGSDEDRGKSRTPSAEDRGWSHRLGTRWSDDREVECRRVWFAPCTRRRVALVSWFSLKTKVDSLTVVWPRNH